MKKVAVLGAGMIGRTIATDLAENFTVTSVDISDESLQLVKEKDHRIITIKHDLADHNSFDKLLAPFNFVISAVPGFMGYKTLEAIIKAKKDVVDISFFPENALKLDSIAKQNNVTAIVDCGVAPGMSNLVLGYYNEKMKIIEFECVVGGLPMNKVKPFEYKAPFSPIDVIEEYTRPARYIENGKLVTKPALTDAEILEFKKIGKLESFNTDGLRSLLYTMAHIPNMKEKTLRYPGHISLMQSLIDGGFFNREKINFNDCQISPMEFSSRILFKQWKLDDGEEEFTVMRIKISGIMNNKEKTIVYDLYDKYDSQTRTSSMARTTGYTCTAALNLIAENRFKEKGIFPPELVGKHEDCFNYILNYLKKRNVIYEVSGD